MKGGASAIQPAQTRWTLPSVTTWRYILSVPVERPDWSGLVTGRIDPPDARVIALPIKPSPRGGSGTFLAADAEGVQWWVKPLNNAQGARVTVTEAIVAAAGRLIGTPVCETTIVRLPDEIAGWEFRPGHLVEPGYAHASRGVLGVQEDRKLLFRDRDENATRHAGTVALHDWCWGGDDQWLYAEPEDRRIYSHDHGWYLPEVGPTWSPATLAARVDERHVPPWSADGLAPAELTRLAAALRSLSRTSIIEVLTAVPASWPVTDDELEAVGWFLERRSLAVAARLEAMSSIGQTEGGAP